MATSRWPLRYGFALLAVAAAIGLALPVLRPAGASLLLMAVLLSAWFGGLGPGLSSVALITLPLLADQVARFARGSPVRPWDPVNLGLFVMFGALISMLIGAMHAARRRTEQGRRWLSAVLTSIGDAVIATDAGGRVTFLNPEAETLTGWANDEAKGRPLGEVFHIVNERTRRPVENPALQALREGAVIGLANHTVLISRDDTERGIDDRAAPILDCQGNVTGAVLVFRDVTERRKAERSARLLASIIESSDDAIIGKDVDGIVTSWNRAAERLFGYSAEEAIGRPIAVLAPPDRADEMPAILAHIRRGERVEHFDTVRRGKDGRLVPISLTVSPIHDEDGRIVGASKIARDISERKRAEEALREEKTRLHTTLVSIGDAVIVTDAEGRISLMNPVAQALTGWKEEATGRPLDEVFRIINEETREPVEHPVARVLRDGTVVGLANHTLLIARDGTERPIDDSAAPIRDEAGNIGGVVLAFRDVADHRRWEEALRQSEVEMRRLNAELERRVARRTAQLEAANKELEAFSYSVAHDLRAPLRAIEGFSRILLDKYPDRLDDPGKDYLERVGAAAKRLEQLIGDLLNLSRLTRSEMRQVKVDLSALAEAVAAELRQREPQRRVEFVIAREVVACGDARLLRFVLDNLLGNAWKFTGTREDGPDRVRCGPDQRPDDVLRARQRRGFDMAYVEKLFRPFQRLHTEREFPGTGIGLASVKRVVGRHGGRVWAEGAVDRGATFYFTLLTRPDSHPARGGTTHGGEIHAAGGR